LGNSGDAEDALQKSFLKIWNSIDQYEEEKASFYTWIAQIVRNTSIDVKRLKSFEFQEKTDSLDTHVHKGEAVVDNLEGLDTSSLLSSLDEKYAFVLEYLYLRGYSQRELSTEFDIPLGTIKTRVKKGLDILRGSLTKERAYFLGVLLLLIYLLSNLWSL
jgi:RNA polymerase sigma-70 factor (ECF subfamily)